MQSQKDAPPQPPDGGLKAWLVVFGGFLCQFCSFGFINALGTFQYQYQESILPNNSASSISWILTFQLFLMFFLSQPVGILVDMFGPRPITITASFFSVGGLIALSFAREYYSIFLAQSICFGIGAAGTFMPGLVTAGQYFKARRALALGVVASGSSLGGVIFPIFLAQLFAKVGFGATLRWTALLIGVLLAIANCFIIPVNKPKGWSAKRSLFRPDVFKQLEFLLYVTGCFFFFWGLFGPFDYLPDFAAAYPNTAYISLYTVSIVNASSILGRILPSYFADKLGRLSTMTVMAYATTLTILVIWLPVNFYPAVAGIVILGLTFGFFSGAFVSLMTAALIDVAGGNTTDLGVMLGTFMGVVSFAALTGLPIQGAIPSDGDRRTGLILFCGASMLLGSILLSIAWVRFEKKRKQKAIDEEAGAKA